MAEIKIDSWSGCYPSQWKGLIVPQAMSHPAKFSSKLIRRIYDHMIDEGWLRIGDRVIDPFGGVALGALEAMRHGLIWQGIELEAKFVEMGGQNIDLWNKKFSRMPHWGRAQLTQGDSRFILNVLAGTQQGVVSSPPYATEVVRNRSSHLKKARMAAKGYKPKGTAGMTGDVLAQEAYGHSEGQLADLPEGNFSVAITSPPFRQSEGGTPEPKPGGAIDERLYARHAAGNSAADGYGTTPGNLANMDEPKDDFQASISSPPYRNETEGTPLDPSKYPTLRGVLKENSGHLQKYGHSDGQIGNDSDETFWQAARQIVEQVYLALSPGGHAVWVVKNYVKNKQIVPFCDQWRQLCESVGFVTIHEHHAMLVHNKGASHTLEGGTVEHKTESKSFFRRLAERNGSPRIDYEVVLCMVKV